jgi:hypothetical protein
VFLLSNASAGAVTNCRLHGVESLRRMWGNHLGGNGMRRCACDHRTTRYLHQRATHCPTVNDRSANRVLTAECNSVLKGQGYTPTTVSKGGQPSPEKSPEYVWVDVLASIACVDAKASLGEQ